MEPAGSAPAQSTEDLQLLEYLFDLNGYLVVPDVLNAAEAAALDRAIDRRLPEEGEDLNGKMIRFGAAPPGSGFLDWGEPFCDLLTHPRIMPILRFRLGDCFRLDRIYGIRMRQGMSGGVLHADYGASSPTAGAAPGAWYPFRDNRILEGFVVVTFNLADTGPEYGGFCCIPGSHKSHYRLPRQIAERPERSPFVVVPEVPAGSAILFSEALTHGTTAWRGSHERRSLLYKYSVSHVAWTAERVAPPASAALTERRRILFRAPADPHRHFPSLFDETAGPLEPGYR